MEIERNYYPRQFQRELDAPLRKEGEIFITAIYNNIILPDYYVSNMGRVYSIKLSRYLSMSPDKDGYLRVCLNINGFKKVVKLHRLMLMTYDPIMYPDDYVCNHKDGIKNNNIISNLEWTTVMDNTRHGWKTGLNQNKGEGNVVTVLDDNQVHYICKCLEQGMKANEICDSLNITEKKSRMKYSAIISSILLGKSRRDISSTYNIPGLQGRREYSLDFAYLVCQFLVDGDKFTYTEIMDYLQIPVQDRKFFKVYIDDLLRGRTAKSVTSQYELKHPRKGDVYY